MMAIFFLYLQTLHDCCRANYHVRERAVSPGAVRKRKTASFGHLVDSACALYELSTAGKS